MKISPISQNNNILSGSKSSGRSVSSKGTSLLANRILKAGLTTFVPAAGVYYACNNEDVDNIGYGDPDWLIAQRKKEAEEQHRKYMGYDTLGLGSGYREVDWE